jgi:hypothetical protein
MTRRCGARLASLALVALFVFSAYPAYAHQSNRVARRASPSSVVSDARERTAPTVPTAAVIPGAPSLLVAGPSTTPSPWLVIATVLGLAVALVRHSRRLTVWTLALILLVFVADSAVHSVHHLNDPRGAAHCQVLSLVQHLHGNAAACPTVGSVPTDAGSAFVPAATFPRSDVPLRPDQGRAPPLSA